MTTIDTKKCMIASAQYNIISSDIYIPHNPRHTRYVLIGHFRYCNRIFGLSDVIGWGGDSKAIWNSKTLISWRIDKIPPPLKFPCIYRYHNDLEWPQRNQSRETYGRMALASAPPLTFFKIIISYKGIGAKPWQAADYRFNQYNKAHGRSLLIWSSAEFMLACANQTIAQRRK